MNSTLFMYLDILGFTELIKTPGRVDELYRTIDSLHVHADPNFKTIVFSDTILVYCKYESNDLTPKHRVGELMYLIEFAEDLFVRLIGRDIYFRAIITEGEFYHSKMKNIDAYYGKALIDTHQSESEIPCTGLFLDKKLADLNKFKRQLSFSSKFNFVCLTPQLTGLHFDDDGEDLSSFPMPACLIVDQGLEYEVYEEFFFLKTVYELMNNHPLPKVRIKYLATWNMYTLAYPKLVSSLVDAEFNPAAIADFDWSSVEATFARHLVDPESD